MSVRRGLDGGAGGRRAVEEAVRGGVADAVAARPPAGDVRVDRLRVRVPAGAGAADIGRAVADALARAVRAREER